MMADGAPARLIAIFDWEMATIGDPLADIGYMMLHWRQAEDVDGGKFNLQSVTVRARLPHPSGDRRVATKQRSGRSMQALDWYVTLALWKAVAFMEGNYKRAMAGSTDDPYLKTFGDGVVELAQRALTSRVTASRCPGRTDRSATPSAQAQRSGLLVDWGGVMTTSVFETFQGFCEAEGLSADEVAKRFRHDPESRELLVGLEDGTLPEEEFEPRFAALLGVPAPAPDRPHVLALKARAGDADGGAACPWRGSPDRPDLQLVGYAPLRP